LPNRATITLREATTHDAPGIARVQVDTWRSTYRGIVADDYLDDMSYDRQADLFRKDILEKKDERFLLAETAGGEIVGFAIAGPERLGNPHFRGEVYALYVRPEYQGRGIGRRLFFEAVRGLRRQGIDSLLLWVFPENPATAFYASLGGRPILTQQFELGGKQMNETAFVWDDTSSLIRGEK
jgi:ribosomal protein S18 acetylase RimI-like enzyme